MARARSGSRTGRGSARDALPTKPCAVCGRTITWRKAWERDWDAVRSCSDACRRRGLRPVDAELEAAVRQLLSARAVGASICPSEAARLVGGEDWRDLMEASRSAARRLAAGEVEMTQGGVVVDPSTARGPVRVRRRRGG
ncbi:DUF2256 and DUF3253 domain-containing protein [Pseudokineococcus sp. 1T1Z-3]